MEEDKDDRTLVEAIYEAAVSPDRWPAVMDVLGRAFGSHTGAVIAIGGPRAGRGAIFSSADRTSSIAEYQRRWAPPPSRPAPGKTLDILQAGASLAVGTIRSDTMLMCRDDLERSTFYNEHLLRFDFVHAFVAKVWEGSDGYGVLSLSRSRQAGEFTDVDLARYAALHEHLQRALAMARRLSWTRVGGHDGETAYRGAASATLLVDRHGACRWLNRSAEELVQEDGGMRLVQGRLRTGDEASDHAFAEALDRAVRGNGDARCGGSVRLSRGAGRPPLIALVTPIGPGGDWFLPGRPHAAVVLFDPGVRPAPSIECLRVLYGLTPSEAAVARGIAKGLDLVTVASDLGFTVNTARQYLTRVYSKTETSRQHDLVRLLVSLASQT